MLEPLAGVVAELVGVALARRTLQIGADLEDGLVRLLLVPETLLELLEQRQGALAQDEDRSRTAARDLDHRILDRSSLGLLPPRGPGLGRDDLPVQEVLHLGRGGLVAEEPQAAADDLGGIVLRELPEPIGIPQLHRAQVPVRQRSQRVERGAPRQLPARPLREVDRDLLAVVVDLLDEPLAPTGAVQHDPARHVAQSASRNLTNEDSSAASRRRSHSSGRRSRTRTRCRSAPAPSRRAPCADR